MIKRILLCFLLLPYSNLLAKGTILHVKGQVNLGKKSATKGMSFSPGQELTVGDASLAVVKFTNGNTLKINEKSAIKLEREANKKGEKTIFRLLRGSSFFNKEKKDDRHLVVKAKNVAMGVRGTTFFASYGQKIADDIYMCVQEGVVVVKAPKDKKAVQVKAGQGVRIGGGNKTSTPKFLPWTKNLNWKLSPKEKDLTNKASIEESYSDISERDYD